ncbi:hypothetical protein B0H11DRAFT_2292984 [Mycena galericulata]|nr:hypothetical protein B0H11DRAFT_2292984 [Mycena galericulata]
MNPTPPRAPSIQQTGAICCTTLSVLVLVPAHLPRRVLGPVDPARSVLIHGDRARLRLRLPLARSRVGEERTTIPAPVYSPRHGQLAAAAPRRERRVPRLLSPPRMIVRSCATLILVLDVPRDRRHATWYYHSRSTDASAPSTTR